LALGRAVGRVLAPTSVCIGRDTRESGPVLQAAFAAGVAAEGVNVVDLGVLPTPAIAAVAADEEQPGVVITASHNPWTDNGIKVFAAGGRKLTDDQQNRIEAELEVILGHDPSGSTPRRVGVVNRRADPASDYVNRIVAIFGEGSLRGLRVVLDTANGAMSEVAPAAFRRLGADVIVLNDAPDGQNINHQSGATHPQGMCDFIQKAGRADIGFAFDGDGDRVIAVDDLGTTVDGDRLIALAALDRLESRRLNGGAVVVTVMANLGFHRAMEASGIQVVTTAVGDRFVLDAMEDGGFVLGGEQSGHIIHRDISTTGDGLVAAIVTSSILRRHGGRFSELASAVMHSYPQVLMNVPVARRPSDAAAEIADAIAREETALGVEGRVLVRSSGTEPLVRVMVEAATTQVAEEAAERLCAAARATFGNG
jgi:phosphoglucosamine mutase